MLANALPSGNAAVGGAVLVLVAPVVLSGCGSPESPTPEQATACSATASPTREHFGLALEFLKLRDEHNPDQSAIQVVYHLNRWIQQQKADPRWMIDRKLFATLPLKIRNARRMEQLVLTRHWHSCSLYPKMSLHIEEARWLRATADLLRDQADGPGIRAMAEESELPAKVAGELAICRRLFDWTIGISNWTNCCPTPSNRKWDPQPVVTSRRRLERIGHRRCVANRGPAIATTRGRCCCWPW